MQKFLTDESFVHFGVARPGIPFLCDLDMELLEAPNEFLFHVATRKGRTRSPRTWAAYGDHLYEFFSFLEAHELRWQTLHEAHLAAWRDSMLERGNARSTVNQRLRLVYAFYRRASHRGIPHALPFSKHEVWAPRSSSFLAHVSGNSARRDALELTLREDQRLPPFLHLESAVAFVEALPNRLAKLMGYLALLTGMRREEVASLDYRVLPNAAGYDSSKQIDMILDKEVTPTKGRKTRTVKVPYDLAVALNTYFDLDWPKRHRKFKRVHGVETTRLFLSEYGEPFSIKYLNSAFAATSAKTGIRCNPHMLRSTYATYELQRMMTKYGQMQALQWVQARLGHSSITTTEKYIHTAALVSNDEVDAYQAELCEALRNGS